MLSKIKCAAVSGIEGRSVTIETDLIRGIPGFYVVGLGDAAVKESGQRVKSAIINSGFNYPQTKVVVNLVPAYMHKRGSGFDLAIALGILVSAGEITNCDKGAFIGELRLDGSLSPVKGILSMVRAITEENKKLEYIVIPYDNREEGVLAQEAYGIKVAPLKKLSDVVEYVRGESSEKFELSSGILEYKMEESIDFSDVKGQWAVKEAIAAAVCGNHGLLMIGPPGVGKTMIAKRIPSILPEMNAKEILETSMIYSVAGMLQGSSAFIKNRPFRMVDPSITEASLVGGGTVPHPGEVSLAHNGVLFVCETLCTAN